MHSSVLVAPVIRATYGPLLSCRSADLLNHLLDEVVKLLAGTSKPRHTDHAVTIFLCLVITGVAAGENPMCGMSVYGERARIRGRCSRKILQDAQRRKQRHALCVLGGLQRETRIRLQHFEKRCVVHVLLHQAMLYCF